MPIRTVTVPMGMNAYPTPINIATIVATKQITRAEQLELRELITDYLINKCKCIKADVRF